MLSPLMLRVTGILLLISSCLGVYVYIQHLETKANDLQREVNIKKFIINDLHTFIDQEKKLDKLNTDSRVKIKNDVTNTTNKTNKIIDKANNKIEILEEKDKGLVITKENTELKSLEIAAIRIDSIWEAYCMEANINSNCSEMRSIDEKIITVN
jgi:hypothetical protein